MDPVTFQMKRIANTLKERSASQSHFNDLCAVLDQPTPTDADPTGDFYTFERGAVKAGGGDGWADVWYRGHFAWEYKGKRANLKAAYLQLLQYKDDLENPPLLIVSDLNVIEIHTNFTDTVKDVHTIDLASFADNANLYNARPQWLRNAHAALGRAVWDAYGWDDPDPASVDEDTILARLLALNLERSGKK